MNIVLMSGIPGSGKSTYVKQLQQKLGDDAVVCSADAFFMVNGEYRFDVTKLGDAHGACLNRFTRWILKGRDVTHFQHMTLVVDNTNLSAVELAPYVALAQAFQMPCEIVTVLCDPSIAAARNVHGVPEAAVKRMDAALRSRELPPFWNVTYTVIGSR